MCRPQVGRSRFEGTVIVLWLFGVGLVPVFTPLYPRGVTPCFVGMAGKGGGCVVGVPRVPPLVQLCKYKRVTVSCATVPYIYIYKYKYLILLKKGVYRGHTPTFRRSSGRRSETPSLPHDVHTGYARLRRCDPCGRVPSSGQHRPPPHAGMRGGRPCETRVRSTRSDGSRGR